MEKLGLENIFDYHYWIAAIMPNLIIILAIIYIDYTKKIFIMVKNLIKKFYEVFKSIFKRKKEKKKK